MAHPNQSDNSASFIHKFGQITLDEPVYDSPEEIPFPTEEKKANQDQAMRFGHANQDQAMRFGGANQDQQVSTRRGRLYTIAHLGLQDATIVRPLENGIVVMYHPLIGQFPSQIQHIEEQEQEAAQRMQPTRALLTPPRMMISRNQNVNLILSPVTRLVQTTSQMGMNGSDSNDLGPSFDGCFACVGCKMKLNLLVATANGTRVVQRQIVCRHLSRFHQNGKALFVCSCGEPYRVSFETCESLQKCHLQHQ
eukprot:80686_1